MIKLKERVIRFLLLTAITLAVTGYLHPIAAQTCAETPNDSERVFAGVLNVRAFGAVGDGKTDDTAALRSALQAAEKMGGNTVFVPAGIFVITDTISMGDNCTLEGVGGGSVIKSGFPTKTYVTGTGHDGMFTMVSVFGERNVRIANLVFDANQADTHVIRTLESGTAPLIIENNRFINLSRATEDHEALSIAICVFGARTITRNNYCDGAASDTFNYNKGWHLVSDNIIMNGEDGGIAFNNGAHGTISGNWIFNCDLGIGMGHPGTEKESELNSTAIIGNTIEQCMKGINMGWFAYEGLGAPRNWTISGNNFKFNACGDICYDGPHTGFSANGSITGNTSVGAGSSKHDNWRHKQRQLKPVANFLALNYCDNITVTGNTIVAPEADGVLLSFNDDKNIIIANNLIQTDRESLSLTAIHLGKCSNVTVSANRVTGPVDFFISAHSADGVSSLHVNDNVAQSCRGSAIRIDGPLKDSAILDNRFPRGGKAVECSTMESTTVRHIGK